MTDKSEDEALIERLAKAACEAVGGRWNGAPWAEQDGFCKLAKRHLAMQRELERARQQGQPDHPHERYLREIATLREERDRLWQVVRPIANVAAKMIESGNIRESTDGGDGREIVLAVKNLRDAYHARAALTDDLASPSQPHTAAKQDETGKDSQKSD